MTHKFKISDDVREMIEERAAANGTTPVYDERTGFVFHSEQDEAAFWYNFTCTFEQLPKDHWLLPGNTGKKETDG